ncbi:MAG TPA: hypothetical protein VMD58_11990 [Acidobacteriaceae bacterium]|nr:hypothetical protein [Acidobacteriaceae bacterium]
MKEIEAIEAIFRSKGVLHRGTLLLPPSTALEFLYACHENGIEVLGFDAFNLLPGDRIQPVMDDSLDLTAEPYHVSNPEDGYRIAERFIRERKDKGIFFEFVTK